MPTAPTRAASHLRSLAALLAFIAVAACHSSTEPTGLRTTFELRAAFGSRSPLGVVGPGTVAVHWSLLAPCQPYDASARTTRSADTITMTVTGRATGPCPMDIVSAMPYRAEVGGIPAGRYMVRVVHRYADVSWPEEVVLESELDVP